MLRRGNIKHIALRIGLPGGGTGAIT